jgi:hypothetical protein
VTNELGPRCPLTNELGHRLAASRSVDRGTKYSGITLGAYRRGKMMPWVPGALIDVWTACARGENGTGMPWPHCYFIQTIGGEDAGTIHCPACRAELAAARAAGPAKSPLPVALKAKAPSAPPQSDLPF